MKSKKKKIRKFFLVLKAIALVIDKKIITPITKFIVLITEKMSKRTDKFERWLVKKNTLIFISLLISIAAFLAIDNQTLILVDSYAEKLYDQKVEAIYNTETYVVEGLPETVDVTLIGRKIDMYLAKQLSPGYITVDISNLKEGTHKVPINYEGNINSIDYEVDPSTVNITIYPKVSTTKTATIDTINKESLDAKLSVSQVSIDKTEIIIKGAEHTIEKVANVRALIDIRKLVDPAAGVMTLEEVPLIAYDTNGKVVEVEMVPSKVIATINVESPHKEIPIKVIPVGEVQFGKAISSITSSVTKVTVYGSKEVINKIEYLPIEVEVEKMSSNKEFNVSLVAPEGIRVLSVKNTKISITLGEEVSKEIKQVQIATINLDSNYKAEAYQSPTKTDIIVKGTKAVIEPIDATKVKAIVDLTGYKDGIHEVEVIVSGDDVKASYSPKTTKIKIKISKK